MQVVSTCLEKIEFAVKADDELVWSQLVDRDNQEEVSAAKAQQARVVKALHDCNDGLPVVIMQNGEVIKEADRG